MSTSESVGPGNPILQPIHPASEPACRSVKGDIATEITFYNYHSSRVQVFWLDYTGKRISYGFIEGNGGVFSQQTFVTHPWVIVDTEGGEALAIFFPVPSPGKAVLAVLNPKVKNGVLYPDLFNSWLYNGTWVTQDRSASVTFPALK